MGYINKVTIGSETHLIEPTLYATAGGTASAITASINGFEAVSGVIVYITMAADNALTNNGGPTTLNVSSTGAKPIYYAGSAIGAGKLVNGHTYGFVYDGTSGSEKWILIGDTVAGEYLPLSGGNMTGTITRYYSATGTEPIIQLTSNNKDAFLWQVQHGTSSTSSGRSSGYGLCYHGAGSAPNNTLQLYSNDIIRVELNENGRLVLGTSEANLTGTLYGTYTFSTSGGFNYSGIETTTSNSNYNIWFSNTSNKGTPVYNDDFKYNPSTNTLTIGTGTLSATVYSGAAASATKDGSGNIITTTYSTKSETVTDIAWDSSNQKFTKTINGSTTDIVSLATMGLSNAMHYRGQITADPTVTPPIDTYSSGDVVVYSNSEYVYDGTNWRELGSETSYALSNHVHGDITNDGKIGSTANLAVYTTTSGAITAGSLEVADNTSAVNTTATTFVSAVTQDSKGQISVTKANLPTASTSTAGIIKIGDTANDAAAGNHNHDIHNLTNINEVWRLVGGTTLANGTNFNTLVTIGNYRQSSNDNTTNNLNAPITNKAFTLKILASAGTSGKPRRQIYQNYNSNITFQRYTTDSTASTITWSDWVYSPIATNYGNAIGGTSTPIYITSTGTIAAGTALGESAYHSDSYFAVSGHNHDITTLDNINQVWCLYGGTAISNGTDFNTIKTVGNYYQTTVASANNNTNTPITSSAFSLKVLSITGNSNNQLQQIYYDYNKKALQFKRHTSTGGNETPTWSSWYYNPYVTISNQTLAQVGGITQPIYINTNGEIVAGTALGTAAYKAEDYYALSGHNHDDTYLKLTGGELTGDLILKNPATTGATPKLTFLRGTTNETSNNPQVDWDIYNDAGTLKMVSHYTNKAAQSIIEIYPNSSGASTGILPGTDNAYTLGSNNKKWNKLYTTSLSSTQGTIESIGPTKGWLAYPNLNGTGVTQNSIKTGALQITLPNIGSTTMISFDVYIYAYQTSRNTINKTLAIYHIGGYEYDSASWLASTCYAYSEGIGSGANLTVRFGYNTVTTEENGETTSTSNATITIGEIDNTWSCPQVGIYNVLLGYKNNTNTNWANGWSIDYVTTLPSTPDKKVITNPLIRSGTEIGFDAASRIPFTDSNNLLTTATYLTYDNSTKTLTVGNNGNIGAVVTPTLKLTNTAVTKHLEFTRASANYVYAPTDGAINFVIGKDPNKANSSMVIEDAAIYPGTTGGVETGVDLGTSSYKWKNVYAVTFNGDLNGNASTASTISASLAATTKHYLLGTSTTLTATAANIALLGDGGIYSTTTTGELSAVQYSWNVGGTEKAYTTYDSTTDCINFIFI